MKVFFCPPFIQRRKKKNIRKKEFERGDYPEFQHPL